LISLLGYLTALLQLHSMKQVDVEVRIWRKADIAYEKVVLPPGNGECHLKL
jgi:hypothetical protein